MLATVIYDNDVNNAIPSKLPKNSNDVIYGNDVNNAISSKLPKNFVTAKLLFTFFIVIVIQLLSNQDGVNYRAQSS